MRGLYYIKTTLKSMFSNLLLTILNFILLPILFAFFMAYMQDMLHDNPLKMKLLKIQIVDEDNSDISKELEQFLKSDNMKDIVSIVDKKPEVELIIEKGYGANVLSLNKDNIIISKQTEEREFAVDTFKVILDKYHQSLYVSLSGGDLESLNKLDTSNIIENEIIDILETNNAYETISASMIGFVIMLLIVSILRTGYSEVNSNLNKKIFSTPITKLQYLFYDTATLLIYSFIIIFSYVMFFRISDLSFRGSLIQLIILVITATILVVSIVKTILTLFGAKYGNMVGLIMYGLPLISGELFTGEGNKISLITPTHYLNNAFSLYNLNGNLEGCGKWILLILGISFTIYSLAIIKEGFNWRKEICA
ncbi:MULTISPECIES: ABC transporter permease [unclassified Clostridium]|uniref:ABC transporter permease n=1 Tax=unclassified Clostridium TaxID=2614128 RepID=UPI0018981304|nr:MULTISPECIES: ABC transporter permease [unclassified Clostridium]MBP3917470.1 ABC transporter permease [Clostridium sp.]MEE0932663.1 ABC transporter permease [Clostridium sp.]